jgi:Domain of unknown function (DU1801)
MRDGVQPQGHALIEGGPMKSAKKRPTAQRAAAPGSAVDAAFDACPGPIKAKLKSLRRLIVDTAKATKGVGRIEEALKWGQPSYLTSETGSGSTIRIDRVKSADNQVAVFFHCQTGLVDTFRELYPKLSYSGNRAILLDADKKLPEAELRHCVALALTYHLRKRK